MNNRRPSDATPLSPRYVCLADRHHGHPTMREPVSVQQFLREFQVWWTRANFRGAQPYVILDDRLTRLHVKNPRRYAETDVRLRKFFFADQVLILPRAQRSGLIAHEIGHAYWNGFPHTEADADRAAKDMLGVKITYDHRWPGKGLQSWEAR